MKIKTAKNKSTKTLPRLLALVLLASFFLMFFVQQTAFAQVASSSSDASLSFAHAVRIQDANVKEGSIISSTTKGYALTKVRYDLGMTGVVVNNPAVVINPQATANTHPIATTGVVSVNVSTENGAIKKGDLITSSAAPGVGIKATQSGMVLGSALEDFNSANKKQVGQIAVELNIHYIGNAGSLIDNLISLTGLVGTAANQQPSLFFKYVVAGTVVIFSFILGFLSFGRVANTGLEALGRNPLAGRMIQIGIIINVSITIAIILSGFAIAFIVLRL